MAGYCGYSMSNNAVDAYNRGLMPWSQWKKQDILAAVDGAIRDSESGEGETLTLHCSLSLLRKAPVAALKNLLLCSGEWHHTSSYFNETDFYELDLIQLEELTDEQIQKEIDRVREEAQKKKAEKNAPGERWVCTYLEWSGTRNHPKATEYTEEGIVKGDWFYLSTGKKKNIYANGFEFVKRVDGGA